MSTVPRYINVVNSKGEVLYRTDRKTSTFVPWVLTLLQLEYIKYGTY